MWAIETTDTFDEWFDALDDIDRANVLASMIYRSQMKFMGTGTENIVRIAA